MWSSVCEHYVVQANYPHKTTPDYWRDLEPDGRIFMFGLILAQAIGSPNGIPHGQQMLTCTWVYNSNDKNKYIENKGETEPG